MQVSLYFPSPKYFKTFSLVGYKYFSIHTMESILLTSLLKSPLFIKPTISRKCYKSAPLFVYMLSLMLHHHILPFCFKFLEFQCLRNHIFKTSRANVYTRSVISQWLCSLNINTFLNSMKTLLNLFLP